MFSLCRLQNFAYLPNLPYSDEKKISMHILEFNASVLLSYLGPKTLQPRQISSYAANWIRSRKFLILCAYFIPRVLITKIGKHETSQSDLSISLRLYRKIPLLVLQSCFGFAKTEKTTYVFLSSYIVQTD